MGTVRRRRAVEEDGYRAVHWDLGAIRAMRSAEEGRSGDEHDCAIICRRTTPRERDLGAIGVRGAVEVDGHGAVGGDPSAIRDMRGIEEGRAGNEEERPVRAVGGCGAAKEYGDGAIRENVVTISAARRAQKSRAGNEHDASCGAVGGRSVVAGKRDLSTVAAALHLRRAIGGMVGALSGEGTSPEHQRERLTLFEVTHFDGKANLRSARFLLTSRCERRAPRAGSA